MLEFATMASIYSKFTYFICSYNDFEVKIESVEVIL